MFNEPQKKPCGPCEVLQSSPLIDCVTLFLHLLLIGSKSNIYLGIFPIPLSLALALVFSRFPQVAL
ncbi:hypothetical protein B0H65DRAFT_460529 [Neurospora tetraspora]|uniref:Uncharacterized protein n=1 Tax=Neurospora tetraspora TaxID=94610 RepID=A0AAE0JH82_9PEZI|nr:hypothetical protein B0H65DRAFT_460529 [Neurospora tetraspora]